MGIFGTFDGTELGYRLVGEGEPLICLPGASQDLGDLGGLGAHRQLVLLDRRGDGESAAPASPSTYRDLLVDDIEALREHLGLERVDVLAHASAADLALRYAAEYPGRAVISFFDPEVLAVRANGLRMAYRTWGDPASPPLVLLHGRTANSARWTHIAQELAVTRRVYAIDLRGHGVSDWPGSYGYAQMRDDVRAFLDVLGLERVDLVGHSMGGAVAALVAQAYPERVGRLVMEEPPPFPADPRRPDPVRPEGVLTYDWGVVVETDAQYNDPDPAWAEDLARIAAPALLIAGGAMSFMPQDRLARMAERIPGCRFVTIDAGHLIHQRVPAAYLAELKAFGCY